MESIGSDLLFHIYKFLDVYEIVKISKTCEKYRVLTSKFLSTPVHIHGVLNISEQGSKLLYEKPIKERVVIYKNLFKSKQEIDLINGKIYIIKLYYDTLLDQANRRIEIQNYYSNKRVRKRLVSGKEACYLLNDTKLFTGYDVNYNKVIKIEALTNIKREMNTKLDTLNEMSQTLLKTLDLYCN